MRPIYKDTYAHIGSQVPFLGWGEFCEIVHEEVYPYVIPPSDPEMRGEDDVVVINIRKSHLHYVVTITLLMPFSNTLDHTIL
jgi:hypothetical protein